MIRKITAAVLAVLLTVSLATVAVFADTSPEKSPVVFFDAKESKWEGFTYLYCHIFEYNGADFTEWQTKKERCTDNGDGIWSFDLRAKDIALEEGKMYCIIFSNDADKETYQIFFDASCYEDTVFCSGETTENPVDSTKSSDIAYWKKSDNQKYGPILAITSIGNVVGTACAPDTTPYQMLVSFLKETLDNARTYTGLSDQVLIDRIKKGLSLTNDEVSAAIAESGAVVEWQPSSEDPTDSPATPDEPTAAPTEEPTIASTGILGDTDSDGVISVLDATLIQKYEARFISENKIDLSVADVDGDGMVTVLDATRIQKYKAGLCNIDGSAIKSYTEAISFDAASAGWGKTSFVRFQIRDIESGRILTAPGTDEEKGDRVSNAVWSIDLESLGIELDEGKQYGVVFSNAEGDSTYDLIFTTDCFKDTARCRGEKVGDKPVAYWDHQDASVCGPVRAITSQAQVVGTCFINGQTPYTLFEGFMKNDYTALLSHSSRSSQEVIDLLSKQVGLSYQYEVSVAIAESGVSAVWDSRCSPLPLRAK